MSYYVEGRLSPLTQGLVKHPKHPLTGSQCPVDSPPTAPSACRPPGQNEPDSFSAAGQWGCLGFQGLQMRVCSWVLVAFEQVFFAGGLRHSGGGGVPYFAALKLRILVFCMRLCEGPLFTDISNDFPRVGETGRQGSADYKEAQMKEQHCQ